MSEQVWDYTGPRPLPTPEHTYELRVSNTPRASGYYVAEVWKDGTFIGCEVSQDRDEAITEAKSIVEADRAMTYERIAV